MSQYAGAHSGHVLLRNGRIATLLAHLSSREEPHRQGFREIRGHNPRNGQFAGGCEAIPYVGLRNSATGAEPKDTFGHIIEWIQSNIVNPAISVAKFIYNGLVAVGNMIAHAAEVVAQFAMKLLDATKQAIKTVVEVVKKVVDAMVGWIKERIAKAIDSFVNFIN